MKWLVGSVSGVVLLCFLLYVLWDDVLDWLFALFIALLLMGSVLGLTWAVFG